MEAAPSAKPKRGSPPIPPNYVSLRQLQELRLKGKEEQEKQPREAARKAEIEAMAAAARRPETKDSAVVSVAPARAKERRDGGPGPQWVVVAHRPVVPPPARREAVPEAVPAGVGHRNKGPADAPRGGGKPEGKAEGEGKEKVSTVVASAQARAADETGKLAKISSHGGKPGNKGKGKGKAKASGDKSEEPGSIGGSGDSAGASSRGRKNPRGKKGASGRSASAEPSADSAPAKTAGASPPQGVKPDNTGKPKSPEPSGTDASPLSDSSHRKKADATSAAAGRVGELLITAVTKPEGPVGGHRQSPAVEVKGAGEQMPRVVSRRACQRPTGDWCNGAGELQHGRVWVPKGAAAAAGCAEL